MSFSKSIKEKLKMKKAMRKALDSEAKEISQHYDDFKNSVENFKMRLSEVSMSQDPQGLS